MALKQIKLVGLAQTAKVDGHEVKATKTSALAVFQISGWDAEGSEAAEDERDGHAIIRAMETYGNAGADRKVTAEEAVEIVAGLTPHQGQIHGLIQVAKEISQEIFSSLSQDGKLDAWDALRIAQVVWNRLHH